MTPQCAFKALLFSVFLLFCQQGLANDAYDLEEFREHYKKNDKPPPKKRQKKTHTSTLSPFENIRIGFFRLNLTDDDVSGDDRLETYDDFVLHEQGFLNLLNFYSYYVNIGDAQHRHGRIQNALKLILRIFTVNMTTETTPENKQKMFAMGKSLFEQLFFSATINGESNPYYNYFNPDLSELPSGSTHINHGLVMMFFAFLGPYSIFDNFHHDYSSVLLNRFTRKRYRQALSDSRLSGNISEYKTPKKFANQLRAAGLDTETALLIGLSAMARASHCHICTNSKWPETLEELLERFVPYDLLRTGYDNMNNLCNNGSGPLPYIMYSYDGMQEFTFNIVGIDPENPELLSLREQSEVSGNLSNPSPQESGSDWILELGDSDEEIEQEAGAVGGATGESHECTICLGSLDHKVILDNCRRLGICEVCIEKLLKE